MTSRQKASKAGKGSSREGKGPEGRTIPLDEERREDVFLFCKVYSLVFSRGECH